MYKILAYILLLIPVFGFSQLDGEDTEATDPHNGWKEIDSSKTEFWKSDSHGHFDDGFMDRSVNDDCSNAISLTPGGAEDCFNTNGNSMEAGEDVSCEPLGGGGVSVESVWYRFNTGTLTSMNITLNNLSGPTSCGTHVVVYGPFASGGGCVPSAADEVYCQSAFSSYDPGFHFEVSGLTAGMDYLVQIVNEACGGPGVTDYNGCIQIDTVQSNNVPSGASVIDSCGTEFCGTNDGYSPINDLPGNENLDGNAGTTCPTCTAGDDVSYIVNNGSWFSFCAAEDGTWQIDFHSIADCYAGDGLQMTIFTGTPSSLTHVEDAPSPSLEGDTWTSSIFTVDSAECVYLLVDGFSGDQCDYCYTLTNITGGCNFILPVDFLGLNVSRDDHSAMVKWEVASELNNDIFILEKSYDGVNFDKCAEVKSIGDHSATYEYNYLDHKVRNTGVYYKLSQRDMDGNEEVLAMKYVKGSIGSDSGLFEVYPNPSNGNFNVLIQNDMSDEQGQIEIYNPSGRLVDTKTIELKHGLNMIDYGINELSDGVYVMKVITKNAIQSQRIVKDNQ